MQELIIRLVEDDQFEQLLLLPGRVLFALFVLVLLFFSILVTKQTRSLSRIINTPTTPIILGMVYSFNIIALFLIFIAVIKILEIYYAF